MSHAVSQHGSTTTIRIVNNVSVGVRENCIFSVDQIHESRKDNFLKPDMFSITRSFYISNEEF
jgi:hypothetical protein